MSDTFNCAVRLLARREHGAYELAQKLVQKGYPNTEIQDALAECQRLGLQSDERYIENVSHARIRQGYGPLRIRQELQSKQLDPDLIEQVLEKESHDWVAYATHVWQKKYKEQHDGSYDRIQKQKQFLLYRGFSTDIIRMVFRDMT